MNRKHKEYWTCNVDKTSEVFTSRTLCQETRALLRLNRNQPRQVTGRLTGHCHLKGHPIKCGLANTQSCESCHNKEETISHVLRDCEALAELRLHHLGSYFMKPSDYHSFSLLLMCKTAGQLNTKRDAMVLNHSPLIHSTGDLKLVKETLSPTN
jgi:hypothetical protein